jgi:hypothetical protein
MTNTSERSNHSRTVAVLAGRRPDDDEADVKRFPTSRSKIVRQLLVKTFSERGLKVLICSAACGADLLALDVANELGIEAHIVLPFAPSLFRQLSVVDRPGKWGALFDQLVEHAKKKKLLRVEKYSPDDTKAFLKTNETMVDLAQQLANVQPVTAIIVWDGHSRGEDDVTQQFAIACERAGFYKVEIPTL